VIVQEYEYTRFDQMARFGRRDGIPVFGTFQGASKPYSWLERRRRNAAIAAASGLLVPSARERDRLALTYGPRLPTVVDVPNPIDTGRWAPLDRMASRRGLGLPANAVVVAWYGRVAIERKGLDTLVAAWKRLLGNPEAPKFHLALMGGGPGQVRLQQLLRALRAPNVTWVRGYQTAHADRLRFLSAADIYVLPSRIEGLPVAPLEAMACGLPLVATAVDGIADILPDGERSGGVIVPIEDPTRLAHALFRLIRDAALRERLAAAARIRVEAFSFERTADSLAAALAGAGVVGTERDDPWRCRDR
jgi:starch synthase